MKHNERKHAKLSASGSARWMVCTKSPQLEELLPEESNFASLQGTLAHEICDIKQKHHYKLITTEEFTELYAGLKENEMYNDEMDKFTEAYLNYVVSLGEGETFIEQRFDLGSYIPEGFGTSDTLRLIGDTLHVIDFKYGFNYVSAYDNSQLKIYAVGGLEALDWNMKIKHIKLHVFQPRIGNSSVFDMRIEQLIDWIDTDLKPIAREAFDKNKGVFKAGSHCLFCKANSTCRILKDEALSGIEKHATPKPIRFNLMSDSEKAEVFSKIKIYKIWSEAFTRHMDREAEKGRSFAGLKIVEGKSKRVVKDEVKLIKAMKERGISNDDLFVRKLKPLSVLQELTDQEFIDEYTERPQGKPTLTTLNDVRQAFEDIRTIFSEEI